MKSEVLKLSLFLFLFFMVSSFCKAQTKGLYFGPSSLIGFSKTSHIYHPVEGVSPKSSGYNLALHYGGTIGYKAYKAMVQLEFRALYFNQNFDESNQNGQLEVNTANYGLMMGYELAPLGKSGFNQNIRAGFSLSIPNYSHYEVKNYNGTIYASENHLNFLQNNWQFIAEYAISMHYKLLWADFGLRAGYSLNSIYKNKISYNARNFYIGLNLGFGIFLKTSK